MTCRIRAGEVARPLTRLHPKGCSARTVCPSRRPVVLGSSTPADPLLSTGHPGGGRIRRPPGPPRLLWRGLSEGIFTHRSPKIPTEPEVCVVTHHSAVRVNTLCFGPRPEPGGAPDQHRNTSFRLVSTRVAQPGGSRKTRCVYAERGYPVRPLAPGVSPGARERGGRPPADRRPAASSRGPAVGRRGRSPPRQKDAGSAPRASHDEPPPPKNPCGPPPGRSRCGPSPRKNVADPRTLTQ